MNKDKRTNQEIKILTNKKPRYKQINEGIKGVNERL